MLNRNFLVGCGVGGGDAHLYWRVRATAMASTSTYCNIKEMEMRATVGGADQCDGGTPFGTTPSSPASNLTDNNLGDNFLLDYYDLHGAWPSLGYQFPSPVVVGEILLAYGFPHNAITACVVEYSDDGADYKIAKSFSGLSATAGVAFTSPLGVNNTSPYTLVLTL